MKKFEPHTKVKYIGKYSRNVKYGTICEVMEIDHMYQDYNVKSNQTLVWIGYENDGYEEVVLTKNLEVVE